MRRCTLRSCCETRLAPLANDFPDDFDERLRVRFMKENLRVKKAQDKRSLQYRRSPILNFKETLTR
jgi:hypothetical protein